MAILVASSALLVFIFFGWFKYKTILNPISFYSLGFFVSLTGVQIADAYQEELNIRANIASSVDNVALMYLLTCFSFLIPHILPKPISQKHICTLSEINNFKFHTFALSIMLFLLLVVIMGVIGRIPIYEMLRGNLVIQQHIDSLTQLPIGFMALYSLLTVLLIMFLSSMWANRKLNGLNKYQFAFMLAVLILALVWQGARQFILLLMFMVTLRVMQNGEIKFKHYLVVAIGVISFVGVFILIQDIRLQGQGTSRFELLMYLAWPPLNLNSIIENHEGNFSFYPRYILWEILPNRLFGKELIEGLKSVLYEPTSPSGYLALWYLDFGVVGIIVGSLVLGWLSKIAFVYKNISENHLRMNNLFLWVCITSSVYSHLLHLNFFIAPLICMYLYGKIFSKGSVQLLLVRSGVLKNASEKKDV